MIQEYAQFIKDYLTLAQLNKKYFILMIITEIIYKIALIFIPFFSANIIDYASNQQLNLAYLSTLYLGISYFIYRLFYFINLKIYGRNMIYSYTTLQTRILSKIIEVDEGFTKKVSKGKLLNSINKDAIDIGDQCNALSEILTTPIQLIVTLIIVFTKSIMVGMIIMIYAFICLQIRNMVDRYGGVYYQKQKHEIDRYSSLFSQILNGLQEIKTFNMLDKLKSKLKEIENKYSKAYLTKRKYFIIRDNDMRFFRHFVQITIYLIVFIFIVNNQVTVGILVLLIGYFESISDYIDKVITESSAIREVNVAVLRIQSILDYQVFDEIEYGLDNTDDIQGIVEFRNVSFGYSREYTIKNLNLSIGSNQLTAIVGPSGTGKTSIINLLLRLYKVDQGQILIDGKNIYDYTKEIYSKNVAVVNQKPFIFNMSIRKNLDFIDPDISRQVEACKRVGIHDFIEKLPNGYHTVLRENASNISGGEKQLISLARTLLSKAEILLFDEITASLDPDTAKKIDDILRDLKRDHTIIMITHKPNLMKKADRIIVMNHGRIVGDGTHSQLIKNNEYYQFLQARKSASKLGVFNHDKEIH